MSNYELVTLVLAGISVLSSTVAGYLLYKKKELIDLAMEIIVAYEDKEVSEEEYGKIVQKLKDVVYKK